MPSEIACSAGGSERVVTDLNAWLRDKAVVAPRCLAASAPDGTPLDAWLIVPPGERATPPPLVLEIHGGPHSIGNTFFLEFQILAGCGFAVAYGNPRGSAGYGQAFASAITGDWGGLDASDVLAILDAALAAEPLDATHVAAVGGSYGGFMTTWLLGHTDRFATGISMRACNDFVSFTGATDIGFFFAAELGLGLTAGGMRELFERSPIRAAEHIAAPLLIMHSERDYRCPIDQGEQLFNCCACWERRTSSSCASRATATNSRAADSRAAACCAYGRSPTGFAARSAPVVRERRAVCSIRYPARSCPQANRT